MEYLDENYNLVHHKTDIEVPEGAEIATLSPKKKVSMWKDEGASWWHSEHNEWKKWGGLHNHVDNLGHVVVWQRTPSVDKSKWDIQVGGDHYKNMKIQPAKFALENKLDYCQANAIKYICRHESKNGKQDLEKAKHYIDLLIEHYYG